MTFRTVDEKQKKELLKSVNEKNKWKMKKRPHWIKQVFSMS